MAKTQLPAETRLVQSFKELAAATPIDRITIQQITDRAGVIRPTFYRHFHDKYHLLETILVNDLLVPIRPLIANGMMAEALRVIFHSIEHEKPFYTQIAKLKGQNSFESMITTGIQQILCAMIETQMQGRTPHNRWLTPEHISGYYAVTMTHVLLSWIESGMDLSPAELAEVYEYIISRSLIDTLSDIDA